MGFISCLPRPEEEGFHLGPYRKERKRSFQPEVALLVGREGRLYIAFIHWVPNHSPRLLCLEELDLSDLPQGPAPTEGGKSPSPLRAEPLPDTSWKGPGVAFCDLHGHSMLSYDAFGAPDEWLIRAKFEKGLHVTALTDHDKTIVDHALCDALCRCLS